MMDYTRRQRALAYLLAGVAGYVDAMGFRHLGGVFVSFMSGNTTRLGVDIGSGDWMKAAQIACIIVLFVIGAALGSLVGLDGKRERRAAILWTEAALLAVAAVSDNFPFAIIGSIAMALAMGVENAVFQRNGSPGIGLTYVTGALVKVGQRLAMALQGGDRWGWVSSLWLWGSLCFGAVLGAFTYGQIGLTGLWAACVVVASLAVVAR
ncbi:YoaK family protein [Kaistia nematophila]|uniref:YoaK family protein n=1 Tax=Kaistia nematophila TaxID=2994654 RepID=A0A9X3IL30_9HYPH|nr:YoaK family protein [Kaistia nematophila]MCX5570093.1 YoaK family protein [Kaistia nematophila]